MTTFSYNQDSAIYAKAYSDLFDFLKSNNESEFNKILVIDSCAKDIVNLSKKLQKDKDFSSSNLLKTFKSKFQEIYDNKNTKPSGLNKNSLTYNNSSRCDSTTSINVVDGNVITDNTNTTLCSQKSSRRGSEISEMDGVPPPLKKDNSFNNISAKNPTDMNESLNQYIVDNLQRKRKLVSEREFQPSSLSLQGSASGTGSGSLQTSFSTCPESYDGTNLSIKKEDVRKFQPSSLSLQGSGSGSESGSYTGTNLSIKKEDVQVDTESCYKPRRFKIPDSILKFNTENIPKFKIMLNDFNIYFEQYEDTEKISGSIQMLLKDFNILFDKAYQKLEQYLSEIHSIISDPERSIKNNDLILVSFSELIKIFLKIYSVMNYFNKKINFDDNYKLNENISKIKHVCEKYQKYIILNKIFNNSDYIPIAIIENDNNIKKAKSEREKSKQNITDIFNKLILSRLDLEIQIFENINDFLIENSKKKDLTNDYIELNDYIGFQNFLFNFKYSQYYALEFVKNKDLKTCKIAASYKSIKFIDKFRYNKNVINNDIAGLMLMNKSQDFVERFMKYYDQENQETLKLKFLLECNIKTFIEINDLNSEEIEKNLIFFDTLFQEIKKTYLSESSEAYAFHFILSKFENEGKEVDENRLTINLSHLQDLNPLFKDFFIKVNEESPRFFTDSGIIDKLKLNPSNNEIVKLMENSVKNYRVFFSRMIDLYTPIINRLYYEDIYNKSHVLEKLKEFIHLMIVYGMIDLHKMSFTERSVEKHFLIDLNNIIGSNYGNMWQNKNIVTKIFEVVSQNKTNLLSLLENRVDRDILNASLINTQILIKSDILDHSRRSFLYPIIYVFFKYIVKFENLSNYAKDVIMVDTSKNHLLEGYSTIFGSYSPLFTVMTPGVKDSIFRDEIQYDVKSIGYLIYLSIKIKDSLIITYGDHEYYKDMNVKKIEDSL